MYAFAYPVLNTGRDDNYFHMFQSIIKSKIVPKNLQTHRHSHTHSLNCIDNTIMLSVSYKNAKTSKTTYSHAKHYT